jgi:hypothetical protein
MAVESASSAIARPKLSFRHFSSHSFTFTLDVRSKHVVFGIGLHRLLFTLYVFSNPWVEDDLATPTFIELFVPMLCLFHRHDPLN